MKNKLLSWILTVLLLFSAGAVSVRAESDTAAQVNAMCDGILSYKEASAGVDSPQKLIDTTLCDQAGISAEFYIIALSQYGGYDFSNYVSSLKNYLSQTEVYGAVTREKYALTLLACGSHDRYISEVMDNSIGQQGIMSYVFGLHLLNNGCTSSYATTDSVIADILSMQLSDGGWAVMGKNGDVDVTAMVIQSLAPHTGDPTVWDSVSRGLDLLSARQKDTGGYVSMGQENLESSAQVLCALSSLGIDAGSDSRFIKNGNTVVDAMMGYRSADGSFSHAGGGFDENATIQAFYSGVSYMRMCQGKSGLYILDDHTPAEQEKNHRSEQNDDRTDHSAQGEKSDDEVEYIEIINERGEKETVRADKNQKQTESAKKATEATTTPKATWGVRDLPDYSAQSAVAALQNATADEAPTAATGGYKLYAIIGIFTAAGIAVLLLFILKKRNYKNFIAVGVLTAAGVLFILLTNFSSAEDYYNGKPDQKAEPIGTVTLSIRCDTITDDEDLPYYIPEDGVILPPTEFEIEEGDTVLTVLNDAARAYSLHIDTRGSQNTAYVAGINYLYEFDFGDLSGWMYRINGEFPSLSCNNYTLSGGESIEWLYTREIGNDLK